MAFRFKDLMINVVPEGVEGLKCPRFTLCANFTCGLSCFNFTCGFVSPCGYNSPCGWPTKWGCPQNTCGIVTPWNCPGGTIDPCGGLGSIVCPGGSVLDPRTLVLDQPDPAVDLGVLRQQLQAQLAQVDELEKAQAAAGRPQTLAEAEDLERKLKGALEELQAQKKNLKK
jgi:hypothetical protein